MTIRDTIAKAFSPVLYYSGSYQRRWRKRAQSQPITVVIYYHRIVADMADNHGLYPDEQGVTADVFEAHLRFMMKHFSPVRPSDIPDIKEPGLRFAVTFDDGFEDNFTVAAPILKKIGISGAFFVVNDYVGTDRLFWWEQLAEMLRQTRQTTLNIQAVEPEWVTSGRCTPELDLTSESARFKAQECLAAILRTSPAHLTEGHMRDIAQALAVELPVSGRKYAMMHWSQLEQLCREDFDIGGHTANHVNLGHEGSTDFESEIADSKQALSKALGSSVRVFAYPYGSSDHYCDGSKSTVEQSGYSLAFTSIAGVITGNHDRFELPRISLFKPWNFACAYNVEKAFDATSR